MRIIRIDRDIVGANNCTACSLFNKFVHGRTAIMADPHARKRVICVEGNDEGAGVCNHLAE